MGLPYYVLLGNEPFPAVSEYDMTWISPIYQYTTPVAQLGRNSEIWENIHQLPEYSYTGQPRSLCRDGDSPSGGVCCLVM